MKKLDVAFLKVMYQTGVNGEPVSLSEKIVCANQQMQSAGRVGFDLWFLGKDAACETGGRYFGRSFIRYPIPAKSFVLCSIPHGYKALGLWACLMSKGETFDNPDNGLAKMVGVHEKEIKELRELLFQAEMITFNLKGNTCEYVVKDPSRWEKYFLPPFFGFRRKKHCPTKKCPTCQSIVASDARICHECFDELS